MSQVSHSVAAPRGSISSLASSLSIPSLQSHYAQLTTRLESNIKSIIEMGDLGQKDHFFSYHALTTLELLGCVAGVDTTRLPVDSIARDRRSVRSKQIVSRLRREERLIRLRSDLDRPHEAHEQLHQIQEHLKVCDRSCASTPATAVATAWPLPN